MSYEIILSSKLCPICMSKTTDFTTLICSHDFCDSCLSTYLSLKILEADVRKINCPSCSIEIDDQIILSSVGEEMHKKYINFKTIKTLEQDLYVK